MYIYEYTYIYIYIYIIHTYIVVRSPADVMRRRARWLFEVASGGASHGRRPDKIRANEDTTQCGLGKYATVHCISLVCFSRISGCRPMPWRSAAVAPPLKGTQRYREKELPARRARRKLHHAARGWGRRSLPPPRAFRLALARRADRPAVRTNLRDGHVGGVV